MIERQSVVVDGIRLSYVERDAVGVEEKAPLLLLHGLIASAETFAALVRELPVDRRIIALNLPGTELAGPSDLSLRGLAKLVVAFAAVVGLERPIVLGHSHGGAIALQIGASFSGAVGGLILLCPAHPFLHRERPLIWFYNSWIGGMVARSFRLFPQWCQGLGFRRLMGPKGRKVDVDFKPYRASLAEPATVESVLRLIKTWNADMDALGREIEAEPIRLPVLFLWGDSDPVVPIGTAAALQKHMTRWEQFTLRGVGHLPNDEAAGECGKIIRTWLIWLDTGRLALGRE
ncbi:MAG TPA: alpha/beta hydrolase [Acidobacteriaceae bacterium]